MKVNAFCITIFAKTLEFLSNIKPGDILRLDRISVQPSINDRNKVGFLVQDRNNDNQIVVFPGDGRDDPFCPDPAFNVTEQDVKKVEELKVWYKEIKNSRSFVPSVI